MSLFLNYFFDTVYETASLKDAKQKVNSTILVTELSADGIELIDYAKSINNTIIVIVYAEKPTVELLLHIVERGITKFITHPFDAIKFGQALEKIYTEFFAVDNLKISPLYYIDVKKKSLYFNYTQINLTRLETKLIFFLYEHKNQAIPYSNIIEALHANKKSNKNALKNLVKDLRNKCKMLPLQTVPFIGYKLVVMENL